MDRPSLTKEEEEFLEDKFQIGKDKVKDEDEDGNNRM